jgi:hypothetical protein
MPSFGAEWQVLRCSEGVGPALQGDAFTSASARSAKRIEFARPDPQLPPGAAAPAKGKAKATKAETTKR